MGTGDEKSGAGPERFGGIAGENGSEFFTNVQIMTRNKKVIDLRLAMIQD